MLSPFISGTLEAALLLHKGMMNSIDFSFLLAMVTTGMNPRRVDLSFISFILNFFQVATLGGEA